MAENENNPNELDELGKEMEDALKSIGQDIPVAPAPEQAIPTQAVAASSTPAGGSNDLLNALTGPGGGMSDKDKKTHNDLQFILDIPFEVTIEVGRAEMVVKDVVNLGQGSVIELDRLTGENLDVLINGRVIGQGEVVVVNDKFGLRLKKVITPQERIEQLR